MSAKQILVPVEFFSADSDAALDVTGTLARGLGAHVQLLHVLSPESPLEGLVPGADDDNPDLDEQKRALAGLAQLATLLRSDGVGSVELLALPGNPADQILRHAHDEAVDLIVMGTHGRGGLSEFLVGSVTGSVMKRAGCVVVTVHAPRTAVAPIRTVS
jgi:nucleotide-binding universal stress UspA family protein